MRFTVHKKIENSDVASDVMSFYVEDLIKKGKEVDDVSISILDNGESITYKECCRLLNKYVEYEKFEGNIKNAIERKIEEYEISGKQDYFIEYRLKVEVLNWVLRLINDYSVKDKRFFMDEGQEVCHIYDNGEYLSPAEVVELLNNQEEKINELKQIIEGDLIND